MIHQYKLSGYNIVLDVCSGSVHVVDEVAYDIISEFESKEKNQLITEIFEKYSSCEDITRDDVVECYDQIVELKKKRKAFCSRYI